MIWVCLRIGSRPKNDGVYNGLSSFSSLKCHVGGCTISRHTHLINKNIWINSNDLVATSLEWRLGRIGATESQHILESSFQFGELKHDSSRMLSMVAFSKGSKSNVNLGSMTLVRIGFRIEIAGVVFPSLNQPLSNYPPVMTNIAIEHGP